MLFLNKNKFRQFPFTIRSNVTEQYAIFSLPTQIHNLEIWSLRVSAQMSLHLYFRKLNGEHPQYQFFNMWKSGIKLMRYWKFRKTYHWSLTAHCISNIAQILLKHSHHSSHYMVIYHARRFPSRLCFMPSTGRLGTLFDVVCSKAQEPSNFSLPFLLPSSQAEAVVIQLWI